MSMRIISIWLAVCTLAAAQGPCLPIAPSGEWPVTAAPHTYTYTDGYQVQMTVRAPSVAPPPCGWPLVVCVHGGGGSKAVVSALATSIASRGYATMAYDVRGQGPSMGLNDPASFGATTDGLRELIDLFEVMEAAEAAFPNLIDFDRIGVTGFSQGAGHSWKAAANSGRLPPTNPWRTAAFPVISCAIPKDGGGPGFGTGPNAGLGLRNKFVEKMFGPSGIHYVPAQRAQMQAWILAGDFAAIAAHRSNAELDPNILLPASEVPVFAHVSYDDYRIPASGVLKSWQLLNVFLPTRLQGGTGGHKSPNNARDSLRFNMTRYRWLDRFLKDIPNGVDLSPPVDLSITPEVIATYQDPSSLRDFRTMDDVPAAGTVTETLFLDAGGQLSSMAPGGAGAATLTHTVPASVDIASYSAALPSAAEVLSGFGLNTLTWDSPPLAEDKHFQGEAALELHVNSPDLRYQVHVVLFDVNTSGGSRYVTDGFAAVRDNLTPGPNVLNLSLYLQSYVFRAGHRVRVQIENLVIHRPPTGNGAEIRLLPCLQDSNVDVQFGGATPSRIDLPILPFTEPTLVSYPLGVSVSTPEDHRFSIQSSTAQAGDTYLLLLGASGSSPGTPLGGGAVLPLNLDPLAFSIALAANTPPWIDFIGTADGVGTAFPYVALAGTTVPPGFVGAEVYAAGLMISAGGALSATNAVVIPFVN